MSEMFWFRVPSLPKPEYEYLKLVKTSTGLNAWQVVILALRMLQKCARERGEETLAEVDLVKTQHKRHHTPRVKEVPQC